MPNTRAFQEERERFSNNEHHAYTHTHTHTHSQLDVATIPHLILLFTKVGGPIVDKYIGFELGCLDSIPVFTAFYLSDLG